MYQHFDIKGHSIDLNSTEFRRPHSIGLKGKLAFFTFVAMTCLYFWYRLPLWNPDAPIFSGLLLSAEIFGVTTLLLHAFSTWTLIERVAPPPPGSFTADIFIATWNESPELLRRTLLAAKQVSLVRKVWLLDDGCRNEMQLLAQELDVNYIAREDRSHAKAGNLNNALQHTDAEFIAVFDCDHAPGPDFLERTLGYFLDPRVAFVQTPQDFFNIDSFQHRGSESRQVAWHEQTLFYRVIQAGKERWNAAFFCGSCALLRKSALDDIGGFATGTITEDMHTSLRMHKNGWSSVYHCEALAFGLSPMTFEQYDTQRLRWGRGAMQVWAKEGILTAKGLTLAQRLAYFTSSVTYFEGWQKAIVYFLPVAVLLTGTMPLIWTGWPFLGVFALWLASGITVNEVFSRGYANTIWMEQYNFIRYFTFMKATLEFVLPTNLRFSVTPKNMESSMKDLLKLWPQFGMLLSAIVAALGGIYLYVTKHHLPEGAFYANLFWVTLNATLAISTLAFVFRKARQRRSCHRFQVPAVVRLTFSQNGMVDRLSCIAANLSSDGINLLVDRPVPKDVEVAGALLLPNGTVNFEGRVERASAHDIGVRFTWRDRRGADTLDSYLYGNPLQWDVNSWQEVTHSAPRGLLSRLLTLDARNESKWEFAHVTSSGNSVDCLIRHEKQSVRVLSQLPLPGSSELSVDDMAGDSMADFRVVAQREYRFEGGVSYLSVLARGEVGARGFHREPAWTQKGRPHHAQH